ncbi:hypothetical protein TNCV_2298861 [Trichonephila clavipes]|nr:hypothetical protein TNCV_2298861 [Trichonephila clavipes]
MVSPAGQAMYDVIDCPCIFMIHQLWNDQCTVFEKGDTRNRWRDGQVSRCGEGTMAPWARQLGCVLACYAPIGRGGGQERDFEDRGKGERAEKKEEEGLGGERTEGRRKDGKERERETERGTERESGRESEARLEWRKRAESGNWSEKDDERRWR